MSAVVVRTGFRTLRGQLVQNVLATKEVPIPYERDALAFLVALVLSGFFQRMSLFLCHFDRMTNMCVCVCVHRFRWYCVFDCLH